MKALTETVTNLLYEVHDSPNLALASRARVVEWLSAGKEWALVEMLEELFQIAEEAGITTSQLMTRLAFELDTEPVPQVQERFFRDVPLPPGLTGEHLREAMNQTQQMIARVNQSLRFGAGFPLINFIQANNFSGIVSNILTDSLDQISPYKHNHDQRFPDLRNPLNGVGLEMKASNKPGKGGESHNGHGGWHLVSCFELDETSGNMLFVHIETAELVGYIDEPEGDWHYCGSTVNEETGSQRTETYYTTGRGTSKLRDGSIYLNTDRVNNWKRWRHDKSYPIPLHSPLYFQRIDNRTKAPSLRNPDTLVSWSTVKNQWLSGNWRGIPHMWGLASPAKVVQLAHHIQGGHQPWQFHSVLKIVPSPHCTFPWNYQGLKSSV